MHESHSRSFVCHAGVGCFTQKSFFLTYDGPAGVDETLLDRVFETTRVSRGIIAFHVAFMRTIARPGKLPLEKMADQADSLYGYASEGQIKHIQSIRREAKRSRHGRSTAS